jgi:hypothetical protein
LILLALPIVRPQSEMIFLVILPLSIVGRGWGPGGLVARWTKRHSGAGPSLPGQPEDRLKTTVYQSCQVFLRYRK